MFDDIFDGMMPDMNNDGHSNFLDSHTLNEMANDTEELEHEELKKKRKQKSKKTKKLATRKISK